MNTWALILANVHYILSKNLGKRAATDSIRYIMDMLNVFPFGSDHLASAVETNSSDFEDTIQYHIAAGNKCDLIISRNIKHYQKFDLPVLTAGQFLRSIL